MATWTHLIATGSTSNTTSYVSGAFTPTVGGLLGFYVSVTASVAAAPTLTASANGITFTVLTTTAVRTTSTDTLYFFVANQLVPASPVSMTVTFATSDAATACVITGGQAAGMTRVGSSAVRQVDDADNVASGTAPATVFPAVALTENLTLFGQASAVGTARTAPTGWTKVGEIFTTSPTGGAFYAHRPSGFTGTTITSGNTANGLCCALAVEFDTTETVNAAAQNATSTGTANTPATSITAAAEAPTGAGTASNPATAAGVPAGVAAAVGVAFDVTVNLSEAGGGDVNAPAGSAPGTGTADNPTTRVTVTAGTVAGTGTSNNPTTSITVTADAPVGTGAANNPATIVTATAGPAAGTGTANNPTANITVTAGPAAGAGTAFNATVSLDEFGDVNATAQSATGTGTASNPTASVTATAGSTVGSGAAFNATVNMGVTVGSASGTGTAYNATVSLAETTTSTQGTMRTVRIVVATMRTPA